MDGQPVAARPIGDGGLGTLSAGFPGARPDTIRIDAVLNILAEAAEERAAAPAPAARATRP